jgi:hypothetical protein
VSRLCAWDDHHVKWTAGFKVDERGKGRESTEERESSKGRESTEEREREREQ